MNKAWNTVTHLLLASMLALVSLLAAFPAVLADTCSELVANGGFESVGGWQLGVSPVPPQYVTYTAHGGTHSLQLGITSGANVESFSSARQLVSIPASASAVTLSFWFYAMADAPATTDYMELALLNADGSAILAKPWLSHNDSRLWNQILFDLSAWRGQTVQLYFNVYNDGVGGRAAMFIDDVSLSTCGAPPPPSVTWTPTSTPSAPTVTPSPTPGCVELLRNGAFNDGLANWDTTIGDPFGVALSNDPYRSAPYALKLGSLDLTLNGLAAARQPIAIPAGAASVTLEAWIFTQSQLGAGADYQEIALLNSSGGLLFVPYRGPSNDNTWVRLVFNLSAFAGQSVFLRFAVNNDGVGGRTAMYVDDVRLTTCSSGALPTATPVPSATPIATLPPLPSPTPWWTPPVWTPGPPPVGCVELTRNSGFETGMSGWQPGKNVLMPAIVTSPVLDGNYALQLGSVTENVDSYTSVRQTVTVPWGYARTIVSFWTYTAAETLTGSDRQQFVLLGPGNVVWATPWKVLENAQTWQHHLFDLVGASGQTFELYFGTTNDGIDGRTALYLDEVRLWGCSGDAFPDYNPYAKAEAAPPGAPVTAGEITAMDALPPLEEMPTLEALPLPQVYPPETLVPAEARTVADEPVLPSPEWTEVAISSAAPSVPTMMAALAPSTPVPPMITGGVSAKSDESGQPPAPTQESAFKRLTSDWPARWPWVVGGMLLLFVVLLIVAATRPYSH